MSVPYSSLRGAGGGIGVNVLNATRIVGHRHTTLTTAAGVPLAAQPGCPPRGPRRVGRRSRRVRRQRLRERKGRCMEDVIGGPGDPERFAAYLAGWRGILPGAGSPGRPSAVSRLAGRP